MGQKIRRKQDYHQIRLLGKGFEIPERFPGKAAVGQDSRKREIFPVGSRGKLDTARYPACKWCFRGMIKVRRKIGGMVAPGLLIADNGMEPVAVMV